MAYLPLNDATIYYEVEGDGKPIVFIHGMGLSHVNWRGQVDYLREHGFKTITIDIRGHGRSSETIGATKKNNIVDQITNDIYQLLCQIDISNAVFVGYSTGTILVQNMALTYPGMVKGIFLAGAFPKVHNLYLYGKIISSLSLIYMKVRKPLEKSVAKSNGKDEEQIKLFQQEAKKVKRKEAIRLLRASLEFDCLERLKEIEVPILVTYGGNETHMMTYRRDYLQYAPTAEVCLLPNVNHAALTKCKDKFNEVLLDYVQSIYQENRNAGIYLRNPRMINATPSPINNNFE